MKGIILAALVIASSSASAFHEDPRCSTLEDCMTQVHNAMYTKFLPRAETKDPEVRVEIRLSADKVGLIEDVTIVESTGDKLFEQSVKKAILDNVTFEMLKGLERELYTDYFVRFFSVFRTQASDQYHDSQSTLPSQLELPPGLETFSSPRTGMSDEEYIQSLPSSKERASRP